MQVGGRSGHWTAEEDTVWKRRLMAGNWNGGTRNIRLTLAKIVGVIFPIVKSKSSFRL
jgi:hypothetical protein